jgi:hypothetical protein
MEATEQIKEERGKAIDYGLLLPEHWHLLQPIFDEFKAKMPLPGFASIAVAMTQDGEVAGMLVLQMVMHSEPLYINPDYRDKVNFKRLVEVIEDELKDVAPTTYYAFTNNPTVEKMALKVGMNLLDMKVFSKEIK